MNAMPEYRMLADTVLLLHAALVAFVVCAPVLVVVGNLRGWRWVSAWSFRAAHAALLAVVIAESWVGIDCPLTTLEVLLRGSAGANPYTGGFIEYWLQRLLYYDFPAWIFTLVYSLFGLFVLAMWLRYPPRRIAQ